LLGLLVFAVTSGKVLAYHPAFAVWWNGYSIGPESKFQVRQTPFQGKCDPMLASRITL